MKKIRHSLAYQLKKLVKQEAESSFATRKNRSQILELAGKQLKDAGYRNMTPQSLKPKHVSALVNTWKAGGLGEGTIKNRMSAIRWWAEKVGKADMIPRSNSELGIADRVRTPTESKAKPITEEMLSKVKNEHVKASLRLQEAFGLRREESIKINPKVSQNGSLLVLKGSHCKGGKPRAIEIRTDKQRDALAYAQRIANGGALIPYDKNYIQQLNVFKADTAQAKISNVHGFRHFYAQERYRELIGSEASINGGLKRGDMTPQQKQFDDAARLQISQELGHERLDVVKSYLGA